jgi:hypothetical protein
MTRKLTLVSLPAERSGREALKAALAQQEQALRDATVKRETLERLQAIVREANDATQSAADAKREANEFRQQWVRGGCTFSGSKTLEALDDKAAELAAVAERLGINATPVRKELPRALDQLKSAEFDASACAGQISSAIGAIIAGEAAALLERYERIAEEYRVARREVTVLFGVLDPPAPPTNRGWELARDRSAQYRPATSAAGAQMVADALRRGTIQDFDREGAGSRAQDSLDGTAHYEAMLAAIAAPWLARAAQLRGDPES